MTKLKESAFSVIFNGVPGGSNGCYPQDPLLNEDALRKLCLFSRLLILVNLFSLFSNEEYIESIKMKKGYKLRMDVVTDMII